MIIVFLYSDVAFVLIYISPLFLAFPLLAFNNERCLDVTEHLMYLSFLLRKSTAAATFYLIYCFSAESSLV